MMTHIRRIMALGIAASFALSPCLLLHAATGSATVPAAVTTLPQAIDDAIATNPTMQKIRAETDAAHGDVIRARSSFLPQVEASGGIEHSIHQPSVTVPPDTFGNVNSVYFPLADKTIPYAAVAVEQNLYDFGRSTGRLREAKTTEQARSLGEDLYSQDLALAVTQAYLDVLLSREKVELAKATLAAYESHAKTAWRLYTAGAIPQSDVLSANVVAAQSSLELESSRNDVRVSELRFEKIVGEPPGSLDRSAMALRKPAYKLDEKIAYAREHRLELTINDRIQQILKAQKSQATSEYLPQLFARAFLLYRQDDIASNKEQLFLKAGMRWPLFDGLAAYGSKKKAQSNIAATEFHRKALLDNVEVEVTRAHLDLSQALHATDVATKNIREAGENLRIVKERYAAGDAPASEVLDGIASWKGANFSHAQALHDVNVAIAKLQRAAGESLLGDGR